MSAHRSLRRRLREAFQSLTGYDIHKLRFGSDPYTDIKCLVSASKPVLFDVGANVGQTVETLRRRFPLAEIHCFEPGGEAFKQLASKHAHAPRTHLNELALGASAGTLPFNQNAHSVMSSFLPIGSQGHGEVTGRIVPVSTVDVYSSERDIETIHLLKMDTQGYEMEVLRGSEAMLREKRIHLIYMEVTFAKLYENLPRLDRLYSHLADRGYEIVSFYDFHYMNQRLGWTDVLFARANA